MRQPSPWFPRIAEGTAPLFERLVTALADDIVQGRVAPGDRLPPHRELAWALEIGLGTVTRAYAALERRGLVKSVHGRGMFVALPAAPEPAVVDLCINAPPRLLDTPLLQATLSRLAARLDAADFSHYAPAAGSPQQRAMMARWLAEDRLQTTPDQVLLCNGGQHALSVAVATACRGGAPVFTEALTYPGMITIARHAGFDLHGVALDDQGMRADALDRALHDHRRAGGGGPAGGRPVVYVTPVLHNPTARSMDSARRAAIVAVCRTHDALIIEDDVYSVFAEPDMPPLAELAPERCFYVTGLSKCLSPGLRIGALVAPRSLADAALSALAAGSTMVGPLNCLIMEDWFADGTARMLARAIRGESRTRSALAHRLLPGRISPTVAPGFHVWLPMAPAAAEALALAAAARGIRVTPPSAPVVDMQVAGKGGLRLCLGGPSIEALTGALTTLAGLIGSDHGDSRAADPVY
ncbi:GntR family transcriptional regulator [Tistrella bauzanensis]|uniref:GntR family transcriptional regulator n=1 Tax=Tistrella bauzanensis TaxID=657419 RepID=A0ABQ1I831_9PROT|nr:PLP-dependent aminotransferase family protein [Tistrella bauzanensis]GGB22883.1 GntR family transcriptional regulator [Tistrella bauzanensis]